MSDVPSALAALAPLPADDFSAYGEIEIKPIGRIQQLTAKFLGRNWVTIPHVTHNDEVDVTGLEVRRKAWNAANPDAKITPLVPLILALVETLKTYPQFNASLAPDGKNLVFKKYFNVGIAVDTPNGLLVPVLKGCDAKSPTQIAVEAGAITEKARTKGLSMSEMTGACMTISSLGHIGGTSFSPIINAPELAILGVTKIQLRPAPGPDGGVVWKQMLPLSLSYDHRVINGADAARFVVRMGEALEAFRF